MEITTIDLFVSGTGFTPVACPHCGEVENLDNTVDGLWDCPSCNHEFWISLARVVTKGEPSWVQLRYELPDGEAVETRSLTNE